MSDERWLPVVGYEDRYEVSDFGRVRSLERRCEATKCGGSRRVPERILKPSSWGLYHCVTLFCNGQRRRQNIQWLVMESFIGPRPAGHEVCHNDGVYTNNRLANLRYDTRAGNFADKNKHGTASIGERHGRSKLSSDDVAEIRSSRGVGQQYLSDKYGVHQTTISDIKRGWTWKHVHG